MPIHLLPPWCRAFCSARRWRRVSISLSQPPNASTSFFSSSVSSRSASFLSHSSGISALGSASVSMPVEAVSEDPVEAVEMALVLDQRGAREEIEILDRKGRDPLLHRLHQGQVFAQRDRDLGRAQLGEEREEHGLKSRP